MCSKITLGPALPEFPITIVLDESLVLVDLARRLAHAGLQLTQRDDKVALLRTTQDGSGTVVSMVRPPAA
jgi:hypothetical protein